MAKEKRAFVLHHDSKRVWDKISNERAGILIKAIFSYQVDKVVPDNLEEHGLDLIMESLICQFERDNDNWEERAERSRENGKKGGRPPKSNPDIPQNPVGYLGYKNNPENPIQPRKPVSVSVNGNGNVSKNVSVRVSPLTPQRCFDNFDFVYFDSVGIDMREPLKRWVNHRAKVNAPYTDIDEIKSLSEQLIEDHKAGKDILGAIRLSVQSGKWITITYKDDHSNRNSNANTPNNKDVMRQQERDRILYQFRGRDYYDAVVAFIDSKKKLQFQYKPCSDANDIIMKAECDKYGILYPRKKDIKDLKDVVTKAGFKVEELAN